MFRIVLTCSLIVLAGHAAADVSVADYSSIQEALNANPGAAVFLPAGVHEVDASVHILTDVGSSYAIALFGKELPENPPISDVLITDNRVYGPGRDGVCNVSLERFDGGGS